MIGFCAARVSTTVVLLLFAFVCVFFVCLLAVYTGEFVSSSELEVGQSQQH